MKIELYSLNLIEVFRVSNYFHTETPTEINHSVFYEMQAYAHCLAGAFVLEFSLQERK